MKLRALAKINLGLDVTGKREDGYHEVRMVMQTIQMYDQLEIKESKEPSRTSPVSANRIPSVLPSALPSSLLSCIMSSIALHMSTSSTSSERSKVMFVIA